MTRLGISALALLGLAACDPQALLTQEGVADAPEISCLTRPEACSFDIAPLRVLPEPVTIPRRPYTFYPTSEQLNFVDSRGRTWTAPRRTLTDGASIPPVFVSIVGDPTSPEFINAAAVHDAFCGVGNENGLFYQDARWEDVHRMFYDALVTGGVEGQTAKLMFAAVWLAGPRWQTARDLDHVPDARMQQGMRSAKLFIETRKPTIETLIAFLRRLEKQILDDYPNPAKAELEDIAKEESDECIECEYEEFIQGGVSTPVVGNGGTVNLPANGGGLE